MKEIFRLVREIFNTQINANENFDDLKIKKLLHLCCSFGILLCLVFIPLNLIAHKYPLVAINCFILVTCFLCFYLSRKNKVFIALIISGVCLTIFSAISAIMYKNDMQLYILLNLGIIVLLHRRLITVIILSIFNSCVFLTVSYINQTAPVTESKFPLYRILMNNALTLVLIVLVVQYFKNIYLKYVEEVKKQNTQIIEQQFTLTNNQKELVQTNQQLELLNKTKEKLFSIIAHDVRSPISGLKSSLDLLNQEIISKEEFTTISTELLKQVNQLQINLDNLLRWSQSQLQGIEVNAAVIKLKPLVVDTLQLLEQTVKGKKITIETAVSDSLQVYADPNHITLILRNLITNAVKFSYTEKYIYIAAHESGTEVFVSIRDTGIGMTKETIQNLFNPLHLNTQYGTENEKGTGLGLQLCKEFLEKNNGRIWATSTVGKGSELTFTLPTA